MGNSFKVILIFAVRLFSFPFFISAPLFILALLSFPLPFILALPFPFPLSREWGLVIFCFLPYFRLFSPLLLHFPPPIPALPPLLPFPRKRESPVNWGGAGNACTAPLLGRGCFIIVGAMTNVIFYVGVEDKLHFLYGLLARKILPRGLRVYVAAADEDEAARIDDYLWTAETDGFLPHGRLGAEGDNETPVVIGGCEKPPDDFSADAMVWWGAEVSPFFGRFAQLIEIVPGIPAATERARERYKFYQEHGYRITLHNLKK